MKAIISGASRGIGRAIAIRLAEAGYDLILMSRKQTELDQLKESILKSTQLDIETIAIDLSRLDEIKALDLNIGNDENILLINNVGSYLNDEPTSLEIGELDKLMRTNLYSAIELSQKLIPSLIEKKESLIINILSINALEADVHASSYSISKHAFKGWNDALRKQLQKEGVKVSAIYPGAVNTSSWDGTSADRGSMIQAGDIAELVYSLSNLGPTALVKEIQIDPINFKLD